MPGRSCLCIIQHYRNFYGQLCTSGSNGSHFTSGADFSTFKFAPAHYLSHCTVPGALIPDAHSNLGRECHICRRVYASVQKYLPRDVWHLHGLGTYFNSGILLLNRYPLHRRYKLGSLALRTDAALHQCRLEQETAG